MPVIVGNTSVNTNISSSQLTGTGALWLVPTGVIFPFAGSAAPSGWLICDGTAVSRTTYAALFTAIGTTYGAGDGSTTFNLPNATDRVIVGKGAAKTTLGGTGGQTSATPGGTVGSTTLAESQIPAHRHLVRGESRPDSLGILYGPNGGTSPNMTPATSGVNQSTYTGVMYGWDTGGSGSHNHSLSMNSMNVEQPFIVFNYIIKV
jgi:microcystin-dependent protein